MTVDGGVKNERRRCEVEAITCRRFSVMVIERINMDLEGVDKARTRVKRRAGRQRDFERTNIGTRGQEGNV